MLVRVRELGNKSSQFIIATHSPILMAYLDVDIYHVSSDGIHLVAYEDAEQYGLTKYFMNHRTKMLSELGLDL
jgi:predicted ATPase